MNKLLSLIIALAAALTGRLAEAKPKVDMVVIVKASHTLLLLNKFQIVRQYKVSFGGNAEGPKEFQGDHKTPEGRYKISQKLNDSQFYKALRIDYPNKNDIRRAAKLHKPPGGDIMIHGLPDSLSSAPMWAQELHRWVNWTDGCIALTNVEMDEIFDLVQVGTRVTIMPW